MTILFDQLSKQPIMSEVSMEDTPFSYGLSEGAPYLFFKGNDWQDLMGHEIKYYSSGVLLKLKDKYKEHENENSFVFFNNNGDVIFELSNIKYNGYSDRKKPNTVINVVVRENALHVRILNLTTNETEEYITLTEKKQIIHKESQNENELDL